MSVPIRTSPAPRDPIARVHRRRKILRSIISTSLLLIVVGGLGWGGWFLWHHHASPQPAAIAEHTPIGIWCIGDACQYFDAAGALWGSAPRSHGPLLLLVEDDRVASGSMMFPMQEILAVTNGLPQFGMRVISVALPNAAPGDLHVTTNKPYDLIFDIEGDIADQLSTLGVLLADKAKDPAFAPQYIDLRTPGRVYYK